MMRKGSLYSLLFTIFNDAIGWGVVLTIFAPMLFDHTHPFLPDATSDSVRNVILGFLIGSYAITQFISMPLIGALSDHFGRKRILEWTIFGAMLSSFFSAGRLDGKPGHSFYRAAFSGSFFGERGDRSGGDCRYEFGEG